MSTNAVTKDYVHKILENARESFLGYKGVLTIYRPKPRDIMRIDTPVCETSRLAASKVLEMEIPGDYEIIHLHYEPVYEWSNRPR